MHWLPAQVALIVGHPSTIHWSVLIVWIRLEPLLLVLRQGFGVHVHWPLILPRRPRIYILLGLGNVWAPLLICLVLPKVVRFVGIDESIPAFPWHLEIRSLAVLWMEAFPLPLQVSLFFFSLKHSEFILDLLQVFLAGIVVV